jgi:Ni,Fe-hydrogenase III component G
MNTETALQMAEKLLADCIIETRIPEPNRLDVVIDADDLLAAAKTLEAAHWGYLAAVTGLDNGPEVGQIEVLYHFCAGAAVLTLRVQTPRDRASVPSITGFLPHASFYERELREMFGVEVINLSNNDHLFLPDDWPDDLYPLRKDAKLE